MTNWRKTIKIKHLLTEKEDFVNVQNSTNKIANVLKEHFEFRSILKKLRNIPKGDDYFSPSDYANKILDEMYDIANMEKIWID